MIAGFINDLGQEIVRTLEPQPFIYRFRVIQDPSLNAFAVPGGPGVDTVRAALTQIPSLKCLGITGLDPAAPDAAKAAAIAIEHVLAVANTGAASNR